MSGKPSLTPDLGKVVGVKKEKGFAFRSVNPPPDARPYASSSHRWPVAAWIFSAKQLLIAKGISGWAWKTRVTY
ncbi:hypothetical protein CA54_24900 [Symmachiella macrocystis]|uniref:Uncharacterized protein n=1 Tax=Symmachiella macrocystis TaxID=2527985 RepID=A0A5C6BNQ1_9PLAN|nr:hypothetical protein CA54_24900 [Symmachiella macrocystis]